MSNVNVKSGWGTGESWTEINLNPDELSVCVGLAAELNLKMNAGPENFKGSGFYWLTVEGPTEKVVDYMMSIPKRI